MFVFVIFFGVKRAKRLKIVRTSLPSASSLRLGIVKTSFASTLARCVSSATGYRAAFVTLAKCGLCLFVTSGFLSTSKSGYGKVRFFCAQKLGNEGSNGKSGWKYYLFLPC
jgi:hypothetical protein